MREAGGGGLGAGSGERTFVQYHVPRHHGHLPAQAVHGLANETARARPRGPANGLTKIGCHVDEMTMPHACANGTAHTRSHHQFFLKAWSPSQSISNACHSLLGVARGSNIHVHTSTESATDEQNDQYCMSR